MNVTIHHHPHVNYNICLCVNAAVWFKPVLLRLTQFCYLEVMFKQTTSLFFFINTRNRLSGSTYSLLMRIV